MAFKDKADTIRYNNDFNKRTYDRINLIVPKGEKERIKVAAERSNESVNALINRVVFAEVERIETEGFSIFAAPDDKIN